MTKLEQCRKEIEEVMKKYNVRIEVEEDYRRGFHEMVMRYDEGIRGQEFDWTEELVIGWRLSGVKR